MAKFWIKYEKAAWISLVAFLSLLLLIPILYVFSGIFHTAGENWAHLKEYLLGDYIFNTLLILFFTSIFALLFGIIPAWLTARYQFFGKKVFSVLLILPLTIPSYILAFSFSGFFNVYGTLHFFLLQYYPDLAYKIDINNWLGLSVVLALALFPYVYLILYASFRFQQENIIEAAKLLGASSTKIFLRVALPLARPALAGGLFLVGMEVLNDYGAASYFGVKTLTTGIFRTWFSLGDIQTAVKLASNLLLISLLFYFLEKILQSGKRYSSPKVQRKASIDISLNKKKTVLAFTICAIPSFFGFILPLFQLLYWAVQSESMPLTGELIWNSAKLASLVVFFCLLIAFLNAFCNHYFKNKWTSLIVRMSSIGYAIPGAIIAIGVLAPLLWFDTYFKGSTGHLLNASIFALTYACIIRFFAVSYNALEGVMMKMPQSYPDACKLAGVSSGTALRKVYLPLSKGGLLAGGILVFLDVLKELPLSLILRPFNFDTLSTKTFELASDEALRAASIPALCIIAMACLALFFIRGILKFKG